MWAWRWPFVYFVREELRAGKWVELNIDEQAEEAYEAARKVIEQPGTRAQKQEAFDVILKFYSNVLKKLDDTPEV